MFDIIYNQHIHSSMQYKITDQGLWNDTPETV